MSDSPIAKTVTGHHDTGYPSVGAIDKLFKTMLLCIQNNKFTEKFNILESRFNMSWPQNITESNYNFKVYQLSLRVETLQGEIERLQASISQLTTPTASCRSNPCRHGGTCLDLFNGYHCLCPNNWKGNNCDVDVNECRNFVGTDLGCQNGATCVNKPGTYECLCRTGWFGLHCARKAKDCSGGDFEMCGHGTCVATTTGEGIKCICHQGWTTDSTNSTCLTDVNECEFSNGHRCSANPKTECINLPGSFRCGPCPPGYEGDGYACSDVDECLTLPNGGCSTSPLVSCSNTVGSRICGSCPTSYEGDGVTCTWRGTCNINNGGCHPSAQCSESGEISLCICPIGMIGDGRGMSGCYVPPDIKNRTCIDYPCGEHGQCHQLRSGYTCICSKGYSGSHCDKTTNYCINNPCQNGGLCLLDSSSDDGFRCECTAQYSGKLCQTTKICGGVLNTKEGNIAYPLSNTSTYSHNSGCAWVINIDPDKVINVTFSKFDVEVSPDCANDFLQVHDGRSSSSQLLGRFCGTKFPLGGNIISSHNKLYFWFRSDKSVSKTGFALHWNSIDPICGGSINATVHGQISSPGSPGKYPPNRDCYWILKTLPGNKIQLHFYELDIEKHANCSFDYLAIYDGELVIDPLLSKYCNSSTIPAPIQSAGSDVLIHFHSDEFGSGNGFQISFAPIKGVPGCGGYFTSDYGEITSPSFREYNLLCEYKIKTYPGSVIKINFDSFNIDKSFFNHLCNHSYLKIYDGLSEDSGFIVGTFCGNNFPQTYTSSSNALYLIYKTNEGIKITLNSFKILYEAMCRKHITGDSGVITSPGYPSHYPNNKKCEYVIETSAGKVIQLYFQDFNIESYTFVVDCQHYNNLEVRDGPNEKYLLLGRFCGSSIPPVLTSTNNFMFVKITLDYTNNGAVFFANYTTIDISCGGIFKKRSGTLNYPGYSGLYGNNENCTWIIDAQPGEHIKITWNRFHLEFESNCIHDYLELVEIDESNNQNSLGKYCGIELPQTLSTATNRLIVKFISDYFSRYLGFSLTYTFVDDKAHCDRSYVGSRGYIYSPGWPRIYDVDVDCEWNITVQVGRKIKLNITDFDLEYPVRGKCDLGDYLEIRNGPTTVSSLIGKFCGNRVPKIITSLSNTVNLKFHSDYVVRGKGFAIEWEATISGCGGTLTGATGTITSPNYPQRYHNNAECFYKIVSSYGSKIKIEFIDFDLEDGTNCDNDYVQIFDGKDVDSQTLGKFCGKNLNVRSIETTSNYAYIKFRSNYSFNGKGFAVSYHTICKNNITGFYGFIESPGYPDIYPNDLNCLWNITVPKGNSINVTFSKFKVFKGTYRYSNYKCDDDYFKITGSLQDDFHCGSYLPPPFSSSSNVMSLLFKTGPFSHYGANGFRLEWIRVGCGGVIQKDSGVINLDRSTIRIGEMECEWLISTPRQTSIDLKFTNVYMTVTPNCTTDYIEIYNGRNTRSPLLSKICKNGIKELKSTTNYLLIKFSKVSNLHDINFSSSFISHPASCGGRQMAESGYVHLPNYPNNYGNSMNCLWNIEVSKHHRIQLDILDFDLYYIDEYSFRYYCDDYLKVQNSIYGNLKLCQNNNMTNILSKNNTISLQFISNSHGTAKGFNIKYSTVCGAEIQAEYDGILTNDASHSSINCSWTIKAGDLSKKVTLTINHMSLPKIENTNNNARECPGSFLKVYDGSDEFAPLKGEYCGNKAPPMIASEGSELTVQLGSYAGPVVGTFSAHYTALENACGGSLFSEEGEIASPNYPYSYPPNIDCEWTLNASPGSSVYINFENFDLDFSEGCNRDYLEIRENDGAGRLLDVYCGNKLPTNTSTAEKLYIKFHSDNGDVRQGFLIHYGYKHGYTFTERDDGVIASPLYPNRYHSAGEYFWRISVKSSKTILLSIDSLEILGNYEDCYDSLSIYDGRDDESELIKEMCGISRYDGQTMSTTSNEAFLKLKVQKSDFGILFRVIWNVSDSKNTRNCGFNHTMSVFASQAVSIKSPGFPDHYDNNLNCEWVFKTNPGRYLSLKFNYFKLERTFLCWADYLSLFSSNTGIDPWHTLEEKFCFKTDIKEEIISLSFLKIIFVTDGSTTKKGFDAIVQSKCGGLLSGLFGRINLTWYDWHDARNLFDCKWTVKVRPGRTMTLTFENFNITNSDQCRTYVFIHNGESKESPLLGDGKFCGYDHENRSTLITSSNSAFISYKTSNFVSYETFQLRYEEINDECGGTSGLDAIRTSDVITSPNYPGIPISYSACVWVFDGPPGEIIRIDFIDMFDVQLTPNCDLEFVEVRDGASENALSLGKFCGPRPGTIKTSSNFVLIKYVADQAIPRNGFKANVSIDVCGGSYFTDEGQIISPGYPHLTKYPPGTVCQWKITVSSENNIKLKFRDLDLFSSVIHCGTNLTIEETLPLNNTLNILKTFCENEIDLKEEILSSTNIVTLKLYYSNPSSWRSKFDIKGFFLTFSSSKRNCGGIMRESEGYLITPGYPIRTSFTYCFWLIDIPDKSRRIKLKVIDSDSDLEQHRIYYEDFMNPHSRKTTELSNVKSIESVGQQLIVVISSVRQHKFKARFTSDVPVLCGGTLDGSNNGSLTSPLLTQAYSCIWEVNSKTDDGNIIQNSSIIVYTNTSAGNDSICFSHGTSLQIESKYNFYFIICRTYNQVIRIPSTQFKIIATQYKNKPLTFNLNWKTVRCGGVVYVTESSTNIINLPSNHTGPIDCAWAIYTRNQRIKISVEGNFVLSCLKEFVVIKSVLFVKHGRDIATVCSDKMLEKPIETHLGDLYIQYHSDTNETNVKVLVKFDNNWCGGNLTDHDRIFKSPNFPKPYNPGQECTWEINVDPGSRISLKFIERFVVEDTPNCTKDYLAILDWSNGTYSQIAKICGRNLPAVHISTENKMRIILKTDADINLDGFKAQWSSVCGGDYVATDKKAFIVSPGYPNNYLKNLYCQYNITAPLNQKIILHFIDFVLESGYPSGSGCFDNVTIESEIDDEYFSESFCGTNIKKTIVIDDRAIITFQSDYIIERRGFKVSYYIDSCNEVIKSPTLISSNINELENYENDLNCTWLIEAPKDKQIIIRFDFIDTERSFFCDTDYVAVYNGSLINDDKRLLIMCDSINSTTLVKTLSNNALVQFVSDSSGKDYKGFKAYTYFSYGESVGCGGYVNMSSESTYHIKSPLINGSSVYENFLDCTWIVNVASEKVIQIEFTAFGITSCENVNQTAIGFDHCDCDFVELKDGQNPTSPSIGRFCGQTPPPKFVSSAEIISIRLYTDGEMTGHGFEITLFSVDSPCKATKNDDFAESEEIQTFKTPGFDNGYIPRGLNCKCNIHLSKQHRLTHVKIITMDLKEGTSNTVCDKDQLIISSVQNNEGLGQNRRLNGRERNIFENYNAYFATYSNLPTQYKFCGKKESIDLYVDGNIQLNVQTSPDGDSKNYKGVELEISYSHFCSRNYSGSQGSIHSFLSKDLVAQDCYTLITAPENNTISAYILRRYVSNPNIYLEILDGNEIGSKLLANVTSGSDYVITVHSSGKYMLLHNHLNNHRRIQYYLNYITNSKSQGCGGKLNAAIGLVTSPKYPESYRKTSTCEWELETPVYTNLVLHFKVFDLGRYCDKNYVQLADRNGNVISTFCSETPADFTSTDNYVKIVFVTNMNNGGTGWVAEFVGTNQ